MPSSSFLRRGAIAISLCAGGCVAAVLGDEPAPRTEGNLRVVRDVSARLATAPKENPEPTGSTAVGSRAPVRWGTEVHRPRSPIRLVSDDSVLIPVEAEPLHVDMELEADPTGRFTLIATGVELQPVLRTIADRHGLNLVLGPEVAGKVTVSLRSARLEEILDAILGVAGCAWHRTGNLLYVTKATTAALDPRVQGRRVQVYAMNYVSAKEVEAVANGLASPIGNVFVSESDSQDQLKTRELLVVDDTASAHVRIAQYLAQVDVPPQQVLVEAHVLQISLDEEEKHGINLQGLARVQRARLALQGSGFAEDADGSSPVLAIRVDGTDMQSLVELIRQETNSRTLASPKLSVVNRQEARIQIGQKLPYTVATTTQTTTIESVEFLEVGILLTVTPVISDDGNILMTVLPKVSGGKITENGFPEEDTTEVSTTILLPDGGGVIIGGLIREDHVESRAIVPGLGRVPVLGRLFRRRQGQVRRNELVVALVTHVLTDACGPRPHEVDELQQTLPAYSASALTHPTAMQLVE